MKIIDTRATTATVPSEGPPRHANGCQNNRWADPDDSRVPTGTGF